MKLTNLAFSLLLAASIGVVQSFASKTVEEESLSLRKTSMFDESKITGDKTEYSKVTPGESKMIARSFENAPPMIPHDVEGLLPITTDNNSCIGCHAVEVAASLNATAMPPSHYKSFRPDTSLSESGQLEKDGEIVANTSDIKLVSKPLEQLANSRYNCSQCHAPQSMATKAPTNTFTSEFRQIDSANKSNLVDVIGEGVN